ncbi:hypothetical protein K502DRAFT_368821 [Neoconidiobolus thromboides FSU 785]|nr:hypothetical protein K502DRAFT_368821 [Neoconidiobolus thromboides FSU 785]
MHTHFIGILFTILALNNFAVIAAPATLSDSVQGTAISNKENGSLQSFERRGSGRPYGRRGFYEPLLRRGSGRPYGRRYSLLKLS